MLKAGERVESATATLPLEDVLANFSDAVVVMDSDSRIVLFNQAAEELTATPQARVIGRTCAQVFSQSPAIGQLVERVRHSGQNESHGEEILQWRARDLPVRLTCWPIWDVHDHIRGTALVIHDLTYQKKLEEAARRNESLARLGTLVAGLAHEIKNPLAGIKGSAQLLEGKLVSDPNLREYTAVITRETNRLTNLVEDLLSLGAPPKPRLQRINIHQVIRHVLSVLEGELTRRGFQLACDFDPSLPDVLGDEAQLSQVLLNLLKNAMESMTEDGAPLAARHTIAMRTKMETDFHILRERAPASKFLRVEIADQGVGIDPEHAARIFEPFFTTKARGTGLGLAISHRIIADHGGSIRAESNRPNGTAVILTLPMARE